MSLRFLGIALAIAAIIALSVTWAYLAKQPRSARTPWESTTFEYGSTASPEPVEPMPIPVDTVSVPTPRPQFALDQVDLGPSVRLTRFTPEFDIDPIAGGAVEAADGRLYVAYLPNHPPPEWSGVGTGTASRVGILDDGKMQPVHVSDDKEFNRNPPTAGLVYMEGVSDGMPVVRIWQEDAWRYVLIAQDGARPIMTLPPTLQQWKPCIPFGGGSMCQIEIGSSHAAAVRVTMPNGRSLVIGGGPYTVTYSTPTELGPKITTYTNTENVELAGGGRHRFLLVEYHQGQFAGECLEGFSP